LKAFLSEIPSLRTESTQTEFEEYELQYVYPLDDDGMRRFEEHIASKPSLSAMIEFVTAQKAETKIYSNYRTMAMMLEYSLRTFYFAECSELDEEQCDDLAKQLIYSADRSGTRKPMSRLIAMLCYVDDAEDEEDDDEEVSSHSLLALSTMISTSSRLNNGFHGLVSFLKAIDDEGLIKYAAIQSFVQCETDKYTEQRLLALSKMSDWIADLDARMARIRMERDNESSDEDPDHDDGYAGNLLAERKHKTAADYEAVTFMD